MELELAGLFEQNTSYDYTDYISEDECSQASTTSGFATIFLPIFCCVVVALGLLGNGLVLVVLWQKKRSWSVMDTFVVYLSVADILLLLTMPLWSVGMLNEWRFGTPLCKLIGGIFRLSFYWGVFMLVCVSLDQYLSIVHSIQMYSHKKPVVIELSCMVICLFSLLLAIPDWLYLQATSDSKLEGKTQCMHCYPSQKSQLASRFFYHVVGFMLPAALFLYFFSSILLRLQTGCQNLQRQQATRVILALVVAFFISWTPYNITLLVDTIQTASKVSTEQSETCVQSKWTAVNITAALGFLHSCLNPLIYIILSQKFRRWVLTVLRCRGCSLDNRDASLWDLERAEETASAAPEEKGPLQPMSNLGPSEDTPDSQKSDQKLTIDQRKV